MGATHKCVIWVVVNLVIIWRLFSSVHSTCLPQFVLWPLFRLHCCENKKVAVFAPAVPPVSLHGVSCLSLTSLHAPVTSHQSPLRPLLCSVPSLLLWGQSQTNREHKVYCILRFFLGRHAGLDRVLPPHLCSAPSPICSDWRIMAWLTSPTASPPPPIGIFNTIKWRGVATNSRCCVSEWLRIWILSHEINYVLLHYFSRLPESPKADCIPCWGLAVELHN